MKGVAKHPDVGNLGTSGRLLPKHDCRVRNKTLGFAGPGNVKINKKKWKYIQAHNWDQFRTKLTGELTEHWAQENKHLQVEPTGTLFQPRRCCWAEIHDPPAHPQVIGSQPRQKLWGVWGVL